MRPTGIIRRVDDLGHISIPKEIRKLYHIHEGDELEISTTCEGIMLRKHSFTSEIPEELMQNYAVILRNQLPYSNMVIITDMEKIVGVSKILDGKINNLLWDDLDPDFEYFLRTERPRCCISSPAYMEISCNDTNKEGHKHIIHSILVLGNLVGSIVVRYRAGVTPPEDDKRLIYLMASTISLQLGE